MSKKIQYTATNMARPFWVQEMIVGANLKKEGYSNKEIRQKSYEENIFQARSNNAKVKVASGVISRLNTLDEHLINTLVDCNLETAKQITIYSIMKDDKFFLDYMNEIYQDKIILKEFKIQDSDINIFIERKKEQIPEVAAWVDTTVKKLTSQYRTYLKDAGFINKNKTTIEITKPIIDNNLKNHLIDIGDEIYLRAMIGEI
ncbi:MAG: DUF1819 family protein [Clostridium sp.]